VHSGSTGAAIQNLTIFPSSYVGALSGLDDLDGDGVPDLAIGLSSATPPSGGGYGVVEVRSGSTGAILQTLLPGGYSQLGRALDRLEDVTGDGVGDILVGSCDSAHVYSGANGARVMDVSGGAGTCSSGQPSYPSIANVGRVDADGVVDLAVAAVGTLRVVSTAGIPLGSTLFGNGCSAQGSSEPELSVGVGQPTSQVGNPQFGAFLSSVPPGKTALLLEGISYQSWQGLPLPFDLSALGTPGCELWVSVDFLHVRQTHDVGAAKGQAFAPLPIPAQLGLTGVIVHLQWYVLDPGPLPFPGTMSRALQLYVQ
jgi:hypothetical protein